MLLPTKLVLLLAKPICNHLCFVSKVLLQLYAFDFINYTIRRIYTAHLFPPRQVWLNTNLVTLMISFSIIQIRNFLKKLPQRIRISSAIKNLPGFIM